MRAALARAGIDVLDITNDHAGGRSEPGSGDRDARTAEPLSATVKRVADIDVWVSEAWRTGETDRLGPHVCKELGIPFVVVEPDKDLAADDYRDAALQLVGQATSIVTTSSAMARFFETLMTGHVTQLSTFVDVGPYRAAHRFREMHKSRFASQLRLPQTSPWLLTDVAMEAGDSMASCEVLATAMSRLVLMDWQLIVVASGNAMAEARELLLRLPQGRIRYCDPMAVPDFAALCVSCDLYVWPAIGDAPADSLLQAQSSGLPVVAGRQESTQDRVVDGRTGRLTPIGNAESFASAISFLLRHPNFMESFSDDARVTVSTEHDLDTAAARLGKVLNELC